MPLSLVLLLPSVTVNQNVSVQTIQQSQGIQPSQQQQTYKNWKRVHACVYVCMHIVCIRIRVCVCVCARTCVHSSKSKCMRALIICSHILLQQGSYMLSFKKFWDYFTTFPWPSSIIPRPKFYLRLIKNEICRSFTICTQHILWSGSVCIYDDKIMKFMCSARLTFWHAPFLLAALGTSISSRLKNLCHLTGITSVIM